MVPHICNVCGAEDYNYNYHPRAISKKSLVFFSMGSVLYISKNELRLHYKTKFFLCLKLWSSPVDLQCKVVKAKVFNLISSDLC